MDKEKLRIEYQDGLGKAERLRESVVTQLLQLFSLKSVALGVPIESRVKDWGSIEEKFERKDLHLKKITDLEDLVGVRAILLFKRDLERVHGLIMDIFEVVSSEDTGGRLGEAEFGYQSRHYVVKIPKAWLSLPSLFGLDELFVEIQVRTVAQHIWAAASHKLQYKKEAGVPPPVRRAINRVSALLETVDLEFERVLVERDSYVSVAYSTNNSDDALNVDNLAALLAEIFPSENQGPDEPYAGTLNDLNELGIMTVEQARRVFEKNREYALEADAEIAENARQSSSTLDPDTLIRVNQGVYFYHCALAREALRGEFGDEKVDALGYCECS